MPPAPAIHGVVFIAALLLSAPPAPGGEAGTAPMRTWLNQHCIECHDKDTKKGDLDLTALPTDYSDHVTFARWVKVHDRVRAGEMPPEKKARPPAGELDVTMTALEKDLAAADVARQKREGRSPVRRLNRVEFETTLRDLLGVPGLRVMNELPADGKSHGFDRAADALEFSFVHMDTYLAAVDLALDLATPDLVERPAVFKYRYSPWHNTRMGGKECDLMIHVMIQHRTCIGLIGMERDPTLKAVDGYKLLDDEPKSTALGFFRHMDGDSNYGLAASPMLSGFHKLRVSGYSFGWDKTKVVPTQRHGALWWGRRSTMQHYGTVDLPPNQAAVREVTTWVERGGYRGGGQDTISFNPASCEKIRDFGSDKATGLGTHGPPMDAQGVAIEWLELEGPIHDQWPPASQRALFGDLAVQEWTRASGVPKPVQQTWPPGGPNAVQDIYGDKRPVVHVVSADPAADARRLLTAFLRRAFRRPVQANDLARYGTIVASRMQAGDHFQDAMKAAYRAALVAPDALLLRGSGPHALAARLSYFLSGGPPDAALGKLADSGELMQPAVLRSQTERLLNDAKIARFIDNFTGQWLRVREIENNPPDKQLYPEFMPWHQDSMRNETNAYFAELLKDNLGIAYFVQSDFAMLNEPLADWYGVPGVRGFDLRRVALPKDSPRAGGFLAQGAVLKVTANGTSTSPVIRGAFVMERILGIVPAPPPGDVGSVEPDTRGTTTIRAQLDKHRTNASCASCHVKMDPYGFALESFDVTGQWRDRYRIRGNGMKSGTPVRPFVHGNGIDYRVTGPAVDCTGQLPDGRPFKDVRDLRGMLAADPYRLARAFLGHLITYATGAPVSIAERAEVDRILTKTRATRHGVRSLVIELVQSPLFVQP